VNLRFIDLSVPIQVPNPGEIRGGMGAILAADIEYQNHTDTHREFRTMFNAGPEAMPGGQAMGAENLKLTAHAGTHVDAPWHYYPTSEGRRARTIDELELAHFFAPGVVLDLRGHLPGERIDAGEVQAAVEKTGQALSPGEIVCCWFGHDEHFGTERYWDEYPGLGAEATRWLIHQGIKVIGTTLLGWIVATRSWLATMRPQATRRCSGRRIAWESITSTSRSRSSQTSERSPHASST